LMLCAISGDLFITPGHMTRASDQWLCGAYAFSRITSPIIFFNRKEHQSTKRLEPVFLSERLFLLEHCLNMTTLQHGNRFAAMLVSKAVKDIPTHSLRFWS